MRDQQSLRRWRCSQVMFLGLMLVLARDAAAAELAKIPSHPQISARGRVLTSDGQPHPGSRVVLRASSTPATVGLIEFHDVIAETMADEQGRFVFDHVSIPLTMNRVVEDLRRGQRGADIVVITNGYGISWLPLYSFENSDEITVKLNSAATLEGVVSDAEGLRLSAAEVTVLGISRFGVPFDGSLRGPDELRLYSSSLRPFTTASDDGKFRIEQLPADCHIHLQVVDSDHQARYVIAATSDHDSAKPLNHTRSDILRQFTILANPLEVQLDSGLGLRVRVFDEKTNGFLQTGGIALIRMPRQWKTALLPDGTAAITIAEPGEYSLMFVPADGYDHLFMQQKLTMTAEASSLPKQVELRIPSPSWLEGRVVGRGTKTGVGGVTVGWSTTQADADDPDVPFFSQAMTRPDGLFRLPVVSGPGKLMLSGEVAGFVIPGRDAMPYEEAKALAIPVDVPADSDSQPLRIEVSRGLIVRGSVRDAHGDVVPHAIVRAASLGRYGPKFQQTSSNETGRFELAGLNPREDYDVSIAASGVVASQVVRGEKTHSFEQIREATVELRLQPMVRLRGRVVLGEKPLEKVRLELMRRQQLDDNRATYRVLATAVTDDDGRYELSGLRAGDEYMIHVLSPIPAVDSAMEDIQRLASDAKGTIELPDVRLLPTTQSLAGIVVDPDGNPVAGATVSARSKDGRSLSRSRTGPPPWAETDADGEFRLTQLPNQPLRLMAYIRPKGDD
ncbi:MAG TPA: carboxypeptidase regulatory-like domain-containing protein, partial [Pirellulaceae bacterium]|nr:carboxypeptidase regulatory-like domain-containing protein [Pirellulaceae bacterium]